jgi:hypothetical protein
MQKGKPPHRSRMISSRVLATASGVVLLIITSAMGVQVSNNVITWGENTPEWNRVLHLGGLRLGCSDPPSGCADYAQHDSKTQGVDKVFLGILLKPDQTPAYVREYSQLSLNHPALYEVGFDDFVGQCERQKLPLPAMSEMLNGIAIGVKAVNPKLHLGITVYEDELTSSQFPLSGLDPEFRQSVDFVHLYPHYRKEAVSFSVAVQQAKVIFPSAKIVAGVYAYDRRDYLPCTRGSSTPCTNQEEIGLFEQSFKERLGMLGNSGVDWIEFYPGDFGAENHWELWKQPRMCRAERLQECTENTKAMRDIVRKTLNP